MKRKRTRGPEKPPIRVVLADDHAVVRAGIRRILEGASGIDVVAEAASGTTAVQAVQKEKPDVAVIDMRMPGMNGIEVTRWVRQNSPSTAVLILSAYDDDPYVLAVLQAGANGYVLKSSEAEDIVRAVRAVNSRQSALDPAVAAKVLRRLSGAQDQARIEELTTREREVLALVAEGRTNKAVGASLHISARTVQGHLAIIFDKLQVESRTEAVMRGLSLGIVSQKPGMQAP